MKIEVVQSVLKSNDAAAEKNRRRLDERGIFAINLMSAPGSGKTALLEATLDRLASVHNCGVMVGDLQTTRDAERLNRFSEVTVQINTGRGCHLLPTQVAEGLDRFYLDTLSFLFIENVGNMVCPAAHDLGEHARAVLLSVPEGDDKVAKYPTLFQQADVILISKIDLLGILDFSLDRVFEDLSKVNSATPVIQISATRGDGMDAWINWLLRKQRSPNIERQKN